MTDAPPEYTATPSGAYGASPWTTQKEEDVALLSQFDTVFLIDDSASMTAEATYRGDSLGGSERATRWTQARDVIQRIAPICTLHDQDGIDVYFLNELSHVPADPRTGKGKGVFPGIRTTAQVEKLFETVRPRGITPMGASLSRILSPYMACYRRAVRACGGDARRAGVKPINIIVITDGQPNDRSWERPERVIEAFADELTALRAPEHQVGVQFFQVGDDPGAAGYLRSLDNNLERGGRDIVDTVTFDTVVDGEGGSIRFEMTPEAVLKTVLGAVNKRLDGQQLERNM